MNAPDLCVVSGPVAAIAALEARCAPRHRHARGCTSTSPRTRRCSIRSCRVRRVLPHDQVFGAHSSVRLEPHRRRGSPTPRPPIRILGAAPARDGALRRRGEPSSQMQPRAARGRSGPDAGHPGQAHRRSSQHVCPAAAPEGAGPTSPSCTARRPAVGAGVALTPSGCCRVRRAGGAAAHLCFRAAALLDRAGGRARPAAASVRPQARTSSSGSTAVVAARSRPRPADEARWLVFVDDTGFGERLRSLCARAATGDHRCKRATLPGELDHGHWMSRRQGATGSSADRGAACPSGMPAAIVHTSLSVRRGTCVSARSATATCDATVERGFDSLLFLARRWPADYRSRCT